MTLTTLNIMNLNQIVTAISVIVTKSFFYCISYVQSLILYDTRARFKLIG